jgi:UDP-glucose 4-epimerase
MGTHNIARIAMEHQVGKLLFASSGAVYGPKNGKCHPYLSRCKPTNVYGLTKLTGEHLIELATFEDPVHCYDQYNLRISNVYGPWSAGKGSVIAVAMQQAKKGNPFVIHGDGEQRRDFIYVKDLCEAIECCLTHVLSPATYNFATGESISINQLIRQLAEVVELPEPVYDTSADYGVTSVVYETVGTRQARLPPNRTLKHGLEETWAWVKTKLDLSN